MAIEDWAMSMHALERAVDMCLTADEIADCLCDPEVIRPAGREYSPSCRTYVRGRIAIPVDLDSRKAITVIWRGAATRDVAEDLERIRDV